MRAFNLTEPQCRELCELRRGRRSNHGKATVRVQNTLVDHGFARLGRGETDWCEITPEGQAHLDDVPFVTEAQRKLLLRIAHPSFKATTERLRARVQRLMAMGLITHPSKGVYELSEIAYRLIGPMPDQSLPCPCCGTHQMATFYLPYHYGGGGGWQWREHNAPCGAPCGWGGVPATDGALENTHLPEHCVTVGCSGGVMPSCQSRSRSQT